MLLKTKNNIWIQNIHILFVKQVRMISVSYLGAVQTQIETIVVKICIGRVSGGEGGTWCAHTRFKVHAGAPTYAHAHTHTHTLTYLIYDILKNCFKLGRSIVSYLTWNKTKLWEFFIIITIELIFYITLYIYAFTDCSN